ncbi:ribonuclease H-like domain-containing protein [Mycena epipterygia]|nr:ribonuclease H-like domain-containing protein [Mycena epipterygia]
MYIYSTQSNLPSYLPLAMGGIISCLCVRRRGAVVLFPTPLYRGTNYQSLPPYPTPAFIYIHTLLAAEEHLRSIQAGSVIGFDLEWVDLPHAKLNKSSKRKKLAEEIRQLEQGLFHVDWDAVAICLAQIATEDETVLVINLHSIRAIPAEFIRICESPEILKVAPGVSNDGRALWDSFRQDIHNVVSLGLMAKLAYPRHIFPNKPYAVEPGLQLIAAYTLGLYVNKEHQHSAWDTSLLPEALKRYAAVDVHASLKVYQSLQSHLSSLDLHVESRWYQFDVVHRSLVHTMTGNPWKAHCPWWSSEGFQGTS